jgi:hypothetical protein
MPENECEGTASDILGVSWFHISKENSISFIGRDLTLVDAGDYDGDGESEVIFRQNEYNRNGYILFYNKFLDHVDFTWNYH